MQTYIQTDHNCFITALGCILDTDPEILVKEIGHTGLEVAWPEKPKPHCYRGHHPSEAIDVCFSRGKVLVPIHFYPALGDSKSFVEVYVRAKDRYLKYLKGRRGLLEGKDLQHAYAWDGEKIWDPNGRWLTLDDVPIRVAWVLFEIKSELF